MISEKYLRQYEKKVAKIIEGKMSLWGGIALCLVCVVLLALLISILLVAFGSAAEHTPFTER